MRTGRAEDFIIYEDRDVIVCHKPAGLAVQSARIGMPDMESMLKNYLAEKMPGKIPYLGIIHRLDQPVEGAVVFAVNQRAAKELNSQLTTGKMKKTYLAVTEKRPAELSGELEDWLKKDVRTNTSAVTSPGTPGAKKARLSYELAESLESEDSCRYLLRIALETGRHHQIRVQMAHAGMPLAGDRKYNPEETTDGSLALCSAGLTFIHPGKKKRMEICICPVNERFSGFSQLGEDRVSFV